MLKYLLKKKKKKLRNDIGFVENQNAVKLMCVGFSKFDLLYYSM
jgi:hypothetical protein